MDHGVRVTDTVAKGRTIAWRASELRAPLIIAETDFAGGGVVLHCKEHRKP